MKTLAEHNAVAGQINSNEPKKNGIQCPSCGKELWDTSPMVRLASMPPQKKVHCDCGYKGYRNA